MEKMGDKEFIQVPKSSTENDQEVRYVPVEYLYPQVAKEDDTSILDLFKVLWKDRKTVLIIFLAFTFIGFFNYMFAPVTYESDSVLIQEIQSQRSPTQQLLQNLGVTFGVPATVADNSIPPTLYPQIVYSKEFLYDLLHEEINFEGYDITTTLYEFFLSHYKPSLSENVNKIFLDFTIRLPINLYKWLRNLTRWIAGVGSKADVSNILEVDNEENDVFISLTSAEMRQIRNLQERIIIEMSDGLITVKTRLPDAKAAAELNQLVVGKIQEYVTDYKIEKARQNLEFVEFQQEEARKRYEQAQLELVRFRDSNVTLSTALAQSQLEELQNRRNLMFNVYNTISQQVEQARLKVQEDTPVFNVLQRSRIPHNDVGSSNLALIASILLGVIVGVVWVFTKMALSMIRTHIQD